MERAELNMNVAQAAAAIGSVAEMLTDIRDELTNMRRELTDIRVMLDKMGKVYLAEAIARQQHETV